jgi:hypothetical protein
MAGSVNRRKGTEDIFNFTNTKKKHQIDTVSTYFENTIRVLCPFLVGIIPM